METVIVSLGGSVILSDEATAAFLKDLSSLLDKLSKRFKLYVVVGGGKIARQYINLGRQLGFNEATLDQIGIEITRVNAQMLTNLLHDSNEEIPHTTDKAIGMQKSVVVMGGTNPKHSTDLVGAELAKKTKAVRFVNATNVDGVYDKDPHKYPDAKQLQEITIDELINTYGTNWEAAGKNVIMDGPALAVIKQAKIPTCVVNGKRLDELEKAIIGTSFDGTIIRV